MTRRILTLAALAAIGTSCAAAPTAPPPTPQIIWATPEPTPQIIYVTPAPTATPAPTPPPLTAAEQTGYALIRDYLDTMNRSDRRTWCYSLNTLGIDGATNIWRHENTPGTRRYFTRRAVSTALRDWQSDNCNRSTAT